MYMGSMSPNEARLWASTSSDLTLGTNNTERMRIDTSGNVGIGTTASVRLHAANVSGEVFRLSNTTAGERLHFYARSSASVSRIESQNSDLEVYAFDPNALKFGTNNTERMRIDSSGRVGIGNSSPAVALDVNGTIYSRYTAAVGAASLYLTGGYAKFGKDSNVRMDIINAGGLDSASPFWVGYQWTPPDVITNSSSANSFPRTSFYFNYSTVTNPSNMAWNMYVGNNNGVPIGINLGTESAGNINLITNSNTRLTVTSGGNVVLLASAARIQGDFSNATVSNRVIFQTSTTNGSTSIPVIPNGTSTTANWAVSNSSSVDNSSVGLFQATSSVIAVTSTRLGTGTVLPLTFNIGSPAGEIARFNTSGGFSVGTTADPGAGAIYATGNITAYYSDDRLKTRLGNISSALAKVCSLNGFYYEANEKARSFGYKAKREVGLSAQEVEAVLPEVVAPAPINAKYKTLHYERVVPLLVEAIKELQQRLAKLEQAI
jgi:hypothetical protein